MVHLHICWVQLGVGTGLMLRGRMDADVLSCRSTVITFVQLVMYYFRMRSWKALEELHDELKIRAIGVSSTYFRYFAL